MDVNITCPHTFASFHIFDPFSWQKKLRPISVLAFLKLMYFFELGCFTIKWPSTEEQGAKWAGLTFAPVEILHTFVKAFLDMQMS